MDTVNISMGVIVLLVGMALIFDFMNGFHDAANAIATVVVSAAVIDAEAQALHKRATEAEEQLELFTGPRVVTDAFPPRDVHGNARPATAPKVQTRNNPEGLL